MGDIKGFLKTARQEARYRPVCERVMDSSSVVEPRSEKLSQEQASRCMDCSTPFCHWGCPIANYIPEWNDHIFHGRWAQAITLLEATNDLPEITGRICPALCEYSCVLALNDDAVTIRENELAAAEYGFSNAIIRPLKIRKRTGKKVAIIGSGPAGLTCASQLNRKGHSVTVFERDEKPGGILRYGIPDFKLEKGILDRRIDIWKKEGVIFKTGIDIGRKYPLKKLLDEFDAICLATGSRVPRDIEIEGRELKGICFAMDYLTQANRHIAGENIPKADLIDAKGKKVVVIGGGDTGADCVGTANRQKAACVTQIEVMPRPAECRTFDYPWPKYPMLLKTTSSHYEGCARIWAVLTKRFNGQRGHIKSLSCVRLDFVTEPGKPCPAMKEIRESEFEIEADLVIIAAGFLHPEHNGLLSDLGIELDQRGNIKTGGDNATSIDKVFAAGDARRGQSLVVWAIFEGRRSAYYMNRYLTGEK